MSRFGTHELLVLSIENMTNESRRHCRARVKAWKIKPAINDYGPYNPQPIQPLWDWRLPQFPTITTPNTAQPIAWWQNPVVSVC